MKVILIFMKEHTLPENLSINRPKNCWVLVPYHFEYSQGHVINAQKSIYPVVVINHHKKK
jgi:hypothetical protein